MLTIPHNQMRVQKRGTRGFEEVKFDKITERIRNLCRGLNSSLDPTRIALATIKSLYDGITTEDLDKISAKIAEGHKLVHPEYSVLAARILISNLHKTTPKRFSECMGILKKSLDIMSDHHYDFISSNAEAIDNMIIDENDYLLDYFGYKTLENAYLNKIETPVLDTNGKPVYVDRNDNVVTNVQFTSTGRPVHKNDRGIITSSLKVKTVDKVMDRPQYMFMRVAIALYMNYSDNINTALENIKQCYKVMSQMYFTHATPTLFNSCSKNQQMNSCFLLGTEDSIEGIMKNLSNTAFISKWAGGIGIHMSNIRCRDSRIKGTNGKSSGLGKQLKMFNEAARCWDQGGKRLGAFSIYLEIHHGDILKFLQLKLNQGAETERARDLFYALWVCDLFVKRAEAGTDWSLFSEHTSPGLSEVYDGMEVCSKCGYCSNPAYAKYVNTTDVNTTDVASPKLLNADSTNCSHTFELKDAYTELYTRYEEEGRAVSVVNARDIMDAICDMQRESGTPYICFKDNVNRMTNQKNIGTIKSSNLCVVPETYILTDKGQFMIKDLVGRKINIWNGERFSEAMPMKTGENQKIISVVLSNGVTIDCTEYHKFYIQRNDKTVCIDAVELRPEDELISYSLPTIYNGELYPDAYVNGRYYPTITIISAMDARIVDKLNWFAGYCDGVIDEGIDYLFVTTDCEFLSKLRLLLQTIGVDSVFNQHKRNYSLIITEAGVEKLQELRFNTTRLGIHAPRQEISTSIVVESVEDRGRISDTYCFTEKHRGMGMFNGVLAGNCTEIMEWSSAESYACCTLASINLKKFIVTDLGTGNKSIDYEKLHGIVRMIVRNLDIVIDVNNYPVPECVDNSRNYRPIGIGVQALADVFSIMRIPFLSEKAARLDLEIAETIYHAALTESCARAEKLGSYKGFAESPAIRGELQFDLWKRNQEHINGPLKGVNVFSGRYDWTLLKDNIREHGLRNSLCIALMPTVSTSQILGNNESFEPFASNIYTKTTLAGKFTLTNNAMIHHLMELGLWNEDMKNKIINNDGRLTGIPEISNDVTEIYKTVWELKQTEIMKRAALRSAFVDQSQSLNIHLQDNSNSTFRGVFFYGAKLGLKTGSYYIRTLPAAKAIKNNIAASNVVNTVNSTESQDSSTFVCKLEEGCVMCSS